MFFWVAAGVPILGGYSGYKAGIKFNLLHGVKLVSTILATHAIRDVSVVTSTACIHTDH